MNQPDAPAPPPDVSTLDFDALNRERAAFLARARLERDLPISDLKRFVEINSRLIAISSPVVARGVKPAAKRRVATTLADL